MDFKRERSKRWDNGVGAGQKGVDHKARILSKCCRLMQVKASLFRRIRSRAAQADSWPWNYLAQKTWI